MHEDEGTEMGTSSRDPQEYSRNIGAQEGIFLWYSYYILEVPYSGLEADDFRMPNVEAFGPSPSQLAEK